MCQRYILERMELHATAQAEHFVYIPREDYEKPVNEDKWGLARPQDNGGLTPAEDENAASAYWDRCQACCPLYTEGMVLCV